MNLTIDKAAMTEFAASMQRTATALKGFCFQVLSAMWAADTGHLSSVRQMARHPACQQIIDMGQDAIPLVLAEMAAGRHSVRWFWVLEKLTDHAVVVPEADQGRVDNIAELWLAWGREQGHLS